MYKQLIRPILFLFKPENIHHFTFAFIKLVFTIPGIADMFRLMYDKYDAKLERELFGLKFKNPVGLAAGFDKDAKLVDELSAMGFGFIEIGTLTPKPQPGNPSPRLFRLSADNGLINRMGFNNGGVEAAVKRLKIRKSKVLVGGNIGKNKVTPNEEAVNDYLFCFNALYPVVDYFVVNVSSPNTPNLRALQEKEPLTKLLLEIKAENEKKEKQKPILLKIAPDLSNEQLDDIVEIVENVNIDGIIATNTTISREGLLTNPTRIKQVGMGGLSGMPLRARSTEVIRYLNEKSKGKIPIIAVGGIFTGKDALEKIQAGASLVQIYTGFIYEGPAITKRIVRYLSKHLPN